MQMFWTNEFKSQILFYATSAYVSQLDTGEEYKLLQPVYALALVNDIFDRSSPEYYHHYKIVNIKDTEKQIEGLEFVFVELPKFKADNIAEKKLHELWMRYLTEIHEKTSSVPDELMQESDTKEAIGYLEEGAYSEADRYAYKKYWDTILTGRALFDGRLEEGRLIERALNKAEIEVLKAEKEALQAEKEALQVEKEKERTENAARIEALQARLAEFERSQSEKTD
jgi:hypothetical protein